MSDRALDDELGRLVGPKLPRCVRRLLVPPFKHAHAAHLGRLHPYLFLMSLFFPRTCRVAACSLSSSSSTVLAAAAGVASGSSFSSATTFRSSAARGFAVQAKVDHYAVLGVPRRATKKEIKEKFYEVHIE